MADTSPALTYASYLALEEVLGAQRPKTDEHDEMLFIVIHQVYELWFKQLIHELVHLQERLEAGEGPRALATVRRVLTILKTVVAQIDVLETMTPSQFSSFRMRLESASGFQSAQFRELEAILGRRDAGALDEVLGAQRPKTDEHDELLFIVIHQVYELWFKQLIHELVHLQQRFEAGEGPRALATVRRVLTILKTVGAQSDVLETMTPSQFASFRARLDSASGFQSAQFRELEAVLGRRDEAALDAYEPSSPLRAQIAAAMGRRSVFDSFVRYLATQGLDVPASALDRDVTLPPEPNEGLQAAILKAYRLDGEAAQVAERLVDLDEGIQEWRYRHVKMVERTIGDKAGTGGSSGAEYLRTTLFRPMVPDLWAVRSAL